MMVSDEVAADVVASVGVMPDDPRYRQMLDAARRGWSAWRIAQAWALGPQLVERLGGPKAMAR